MDLSQFVFIAVGLLVFSIVMIGAGLALNRRQKGAEAEKIAEQKRALFADPPVHPAEPEAPAPPPAAGGLEILRVSRRPADGGLTVQMMGQTAEHAGEMTPGQAEQLKNFVREMALWVEGRGALPHTGPSDSLTGPGFGPQPVAHPGTAGAGPGVPVDPNVSFADTLPPMPGTRELILGRRTKPEKSGQAPEPPKSIAAQIDEILQEMLARDPLAGSTIRLSEDPTGGLKIIHNTHTYQAIDDVEDEAARDIIKRAVQVWNEKNRLG